MKVLQINSVCGVGSTGRISTDLYKVIKDSGGNCRIIYGRGKSPCNIDSIKIGNNIDNYIHVFKTRMFDKHGLGSDKVTKKLIKEIDQYNPDIIHLQNIHGYYLNIEVLFNYLKKINKPIIWTLHDCWPFTGHCAYFDFVNCEKWRENCHDCNQKNKYPRSLFVDRSYENYNIKKKLFTGIKNVTLVTPSQWLANLVKESFLKDFKVEVINNGIDLSIFKPTKSNIKERLDIDGKFIILGVASVWDDRKGLKYFNEIASKLDEDFQIILIGITEKQKKTLNKNIICVEKTNSAQELAQFYSAADVFINPTLEDNFPTTNLESLACGTPVITFNTGGSIEAVDDKTGIIVEKGNTSQLIGSIIDMKLGNLTMDRKACVDRARKYYDKNTNFKKYINLYRENL